MLLSHTYIARGGVCIHVSFLPDIFYVTQDQNIEYTAGEDLIGPRAFRVIFAAVSLPLAALALVYFINHRYEGAALWNLRRQPLVHELTWVLNFVSFFFLYPSTFNLLEVRGFMQSSCP